ncbi:MAG: hypothetical protein IPF92_23410 [Myxococcales bacterium]|nr:hypothetical protein [Myxococcales bacterium]
MTRAPARTSASSPHGLRERARRARGVLGPVLAVLCAVVAASCSSVDTPAPATPPDASAAPADGPPTWASVQGERRAPLPRATPAITDSFHTSDACAGCHTVGEGTGVLRDAKGRDVSPVATWRPSMMAMAARDPFYLAVVDEERSSRPGAEALIDGACTRCHAPAAAVELGLGGETVTLPGLFSGMSKELHAGRDGVTCSLCHQMKSEPRGPDATFGGAFTVGEAREIYGPHRDPVTTPMRTFVSYTPTYSGHLSSSDACASCHTVFTRAYDAAGKAVGPKLPEQVTYLEWRNSIYSAPGDRGASCQACHIPTGDDDGAPLATVLSKLPPSGLEPRKPLGRHLFLGGNVTMLRAFASDGGWSGASADPPAFEAQAERTRKNLASAATVTLADVRAGAGASARLEVDVRVENKTGHKFPTGYPSRRAWLHLKVTGPGGVVWESGRSDAFGRLVDRGGRVLDTKSAIFPHRDVITTEGEVMVYEAVLGDESGKVVHRPLEATRYLKDNRLPPLGASATHPDGPITVSYGAERDRDFGSSDTVHFVLAGVSGEVTIEVELLFQSVRPADLDMLAEHPTPTARVLFDLVAGKLEPTVVGRATRALR